MSMENNGNSDMKNPEIMECGDIQASVDYFMRLGLPREAKILDIGTRFGSFLNRLFTLGYRDMYGIDVDSSAILQGKEYYPELAQNLSVYDGTIIPFNDCAFDVICMFDVIEHIPGVQSYLKEVYRIIRPGGVLVFQTPNKLINVPWEVIHQRSLTHWRIYHCSLQTLGSLKRILTSVGFDDIKVEKFGFATEFKKSQVRQKLGLPGVLLLSLVSRFPFPLFPNFWGYCTKPINTNKDQ